MPLACQFHNCTYLSVPWRQ